MNYPKIFFLLLPILFFTLGAKAQISAEDAVKIKTYEDSLIVDGFLVVNDTLPERRFLATKKMILHLKSALKYDHSFDYPFDRLNSISIQYAPDSTFRIFTWQLMVSPVDYRYFGVVQLNTKEVQLIPLADRSATVENVQEAVLSPREWYGALYYNIKQIEKQGKPYYLLFGYDAYSNRDHRKILEVLHFGPDKGIVFGAPVIPTQDGPALHRLLLEYFGDSSVRLNYDQALESIVFDHLIEIPGRGGQGPMMVPDGSYQALELKEDRLVFVDKLFNNQAVDEAPREEPVLGNSTRDLFGNKKGKN
ncbi:MAG TPA: hypothetical protein VJ953_03985 [Saprospiraceae bacterium]|nr:hypothetical protein [Saprospiraceae bacterium]